MSSFAVQQENLIGQLTIHARNGDIDGLYSLISMDPLLLNRIDEIQFFNSPLHEAAAEGQINFALEMMILNPSFGKKLNPQGLTPLHLAIQRNQKETALALFRFDEQLICVKGREGQTPLHYAAKYKHHLDLLASFVKKFPESMDELNNRFQNALHVALENHNFDGAHLLSNWIYMSGRWKNLGCADAKGNTVLHVAVQHHHNLQTIKNIIFRMRTVARDVINKRNFDGQTCLDIVEEPDKNAIVELLKRFGAKKSTELSHKGSLTKKLLSPISIMRWFIAYLRMGFNDYRLQRDMFLLVAVLVATVTYQSALQPPGGVYQGDIDTTNNAVGRTVLKEYQSNWFVVVNTVAFMCSMNIVLFSLALDFLPVLFVGSIFLMISYIVGTMFIYDHSLIRVVACGIMFVCSAIGPTAIIVSNEIGKILV